MLNILRDRIVLFGLMAVAVGAFLLKADASSEGQSKETQPLPPSTSLNVTIQSTKGGNAYKLFDKDGLAANFVTLRPDKKDKKIVLSVPAAFTDKVGKVDGIYVSNGVIGHKSAPNEKLGGAMIIENGDFRIIATKDGALLTPEFADEVGRNKGCLFQQFQLVREGAAVPFKDKTEFQRRAFVEFHNGRHAVIESAKQLTLNQLAADLIELGAVNALNADMGAWDEGWYRDSHGKLTVIGRDRSATKRQTNWFTLTVPTVSAPAKPADAQHK
jgi:hypothetical protein